MRFRTLFALLLVLALATPVLAQSVDICASTTGSSDVVLAGGRPYVVWTEAPTAVVGGFYVEVLTGTVAAPTGTFLTKTDVGVPTSFQTCPNGDLAYRHQLANVNTVGNYVARVSTWNLKLDGTRQESPLAVRPFAAASETPAPVQPSRVRIG